MTCHLHALPRPRVMGSRSCLQLQHFRKCLNHCRDQANTLYVYGTRMYTHNYKNGAHVTAPATESDVCFPHQYLLKNYVLTQLQWVSRHDARAPRSSVHAQLQQRPHPTGSVPAPPNKRQRNESNPRSHNDAPMDMDSAGVEKAAPSDKVKQLILNKEAVDVDDNGYTSDEE